MMNGQQIADLLLNSNISRLEQDNITGVKIGPSGYLPYYRELTTNNVGLKKKIILFGKRVIRKLIRFVVEPICIKQSSLNEYYNREIATLQKELNECKERLNKLEQ